MGKIFRFIISVICAGIAFLIGIAIVGALGMATILAFIIPVVLALAAFGLAQLILGIFRVKNLIIAGIFVFIMNLLGVGIFDFFG